VSAGVAIYHPSTGALSPLLGQAINGTVRALLVQGTSLFIGGESSQHFVPSRRANTPTPQLRANNKSPRSIPTTPLLGRRSISSIDQPPDDILASSPPLRARVQPSPSFVGDGTAETEDESG
jgi:hypothetical protein